MTYYVNLFSPETYEAFSKSDRTVSGFRLRQKNVAGKINVGDRLICYMTKLSRWIGVLEVIETYYEDDTPIFYLEKDPFVIRFKVKPTAWLAKERAIPIRDNRVWDVLSFTKGHDKKSSSWTGKLRSSLNRLNKADGEFLENLILKQISNGEDFPLDEKEYEKLITHQVRRLDKTVTVSVPKDEDEEILPATPPTTDIRESTKIQALIGKIGLTMGMHIWIPKNDRSAVLKEPSTESLQILDILPLNYDETTLKTIEQIDVLWLRGRSIVRAFEVEHTTSIYSGILRMADLLALQPNMDIKLHIVAPEERREKVFRELLRPVFSLLEKGPLSESCTYLSYDSVREISKLKHLLHLSDSVLEEYIEEAE
ncbi:MAG: EVE domain-containing protein [Ardenticatenaceae bacterium]|nr:EVE domain-containing protein [Ardenticatenaceae bacterium]